VKHHLLVVVLILLAGALVTVGVAWGIAILVDFSAADRVVGGAKGRGGDWVIWHHDAVGCIRIRALAVSGNNIEEYDQYPMQPWVLPAWGPLAAQVRQQVRQQDDLQQMRNEAFVRVADAYGWPTHSMWSAFAWNTAQWPNVLTDPRLSAIHIRSPMGVDYALAQRVLPLRPIWPGFAVNTILYAAFLWLLFCGPFVLRRFIRVRRGLCLACGYPMGKSSICSECGEALPHRAVA